MSNTETPEPATERITRSTAAGAGTTARNPRRRARQSDNDTLQKAAPRRKRSKISAETYAPRDSTEGRPPAAVTTTNGHQHDFERANSVLNGHADVDTFVGVGTATTTTVKVNGNGHHHLQPHHHRRTGSTTSMLDGEFPVRGKKGTVKRLQKADGATTLCSNQCYNAKLLPSTPKELKKEGLQYRGSTLGSHALAVTEKKALVWEYNAHVAASNVRVFDMPFPTRDDHTLPFGALVPSNAIGHHDLGLVLISATTGKVVFYESIDRASSLGLFQEKRSGVEGTITLYGSEVVTDIVRAAHATFVVTLSSGKVVALSLKDSAGTPKVKIEEVKILETATGSFGSFSNFFKKAYRHDLTAVRTKEARRGHVQVVGLTQQIEVLLWDLEWSGRPDYLYNIQLRESLVRELKLALAPELAGHAEYAVALDLAIADKQAGANSQALMAASSQQPLDLFILLRIGASDMQSYVVAEVSLPGDGSHNILRIHELHYNSDGPTSRQQKPRLVLPKPGHTFYVVFEDATILGTTASPSNEGPDAQLHASYTQQEPFEDAIRLKSGKDLAFLGVSEETPRSSNASIVAFVKGAGLVRVTAVDAQTAIGGPRISAKSRIEQAVFHGALQQDNIIDFSPRLQSEYDVEEVSVAALEISGEILTSETNYPHLISPTPASMEVGLATKAKALKALVTYVVRTCPAISRRTMWSLLWDAEKLAAGQQLWLAFEEHVTLTSRAEKRKATVLDELTSWFEASFPFYQRPDLANEDPVRRFFSGGLHHMEKLLANLRLLLDDFAKQQDCPPHEGLKRVVQADDIWIRALETAYNFRSEHCADYGILPEHIDDGILTDTTEYSELPEFWTSSPKLIENTLRVASLSRELLKRYFDAAGEEPDQEAHDLVKEIADNNSRLVQIYCLQAQESINWHASREQKREQDKSEMMKVNYDHERHKQFRWLADVGRAEDGMALAEKHRDMDTLATMVLAEDQYLLGFIEENGPKHPAALKLGTDLRQRIQLYFSKYKKSWSNAFFGKLFADGSAGAKLLRAQSEWRKPLTEYLREHSHTAKLCWINDVTAESDYAHASEALAQCAQTQEKKLWNKRVELSLSKLALLAAEEAGPTEQPTKLKINGASTINGTLSTQRSAQDELAIVEVQDRLFKHIAPELERSIDEEAEIENCMNRYGNHVESDSALARLLEHGITRVVRHEILDVEELIDTLTLMTVVSDPNHDENLQGAETLLALTALDAAASSLPPSRFETLLALIWKRAYIYDDWASTKLQLNKKKSDEDRMTSIQLRSTLWQNVLHILESDITTKPNAQIRILTPSECIGAACRAEDLSYRFPEADVLDPIVHDLQKQDEILAAFVSDRDLEQIAEEVVRDVKAFMMTQAEEEAEARKEERVLQESFVEGKTNGHVVESNGAADHEEVDEDGDVEME